MATITWRRVSGSWSSPTTWQGFQQPGSTDTAAFGANDSSTATIDGSAAISAVSLLATTSATLRLQSTLTLGGTLMLAGGTLDLAAGGTIEGGTVALAGGVLEARGGVADGVVWVGALGNGLAITAATAQATQHALGGLTVVGALSLEAGAYDGLTISASSFAGAPIELDALAGGAVVLGPATTLRATADDPLHDAAVQPTFAGLSFAGAGAFVNQGLIASDLADTSVPLTINAANFANAGTISLQPAIVPHIQIAQLVGSPPVSVRLTYDETLPPGLVIRGASFANSGLISGQGATIHVQGATFANSGLISLATAQEQLPVFNTKSPYVGTVALGSSIDFTTAVTSFANSGTIAASTIEFDNNLSLAGLGAVRGTVLFHGTLDLGGGTLDAGRIDPGGTLVFSGTVKNGLLVADGGSIVTAGATLVGVTSLDHAPGVLLDVTSGAVLLNAATTELAYTTAASIDRISVTAGAAGTIDAIAARAPGTLTFGAGTLIQDSVAGSKLVIGGQGTFSDAGRISLDGSELDVATLDGAGTISLANGAALGIAALAPTSAITVAFGAGNNLLSLPVGSSGVNTLGLTLTGLRSGDLIDFAGVSDIPPLGSFATGGAAAQDGMLSVQGASGYQARLSLGDAAANLVFSVGSDSSGGTLVTVSCFRSGTRIATPAGELAVERLRIGDCVLTSAGAARPVRWIGHRRYPASLVALQPQLRPVRIAVGALGHGLPHRPLYLSALHALLLAAPDGTDVLVPAAALVDGHRITRAPVAAVSYVHVELDSADAILAEGAAAETFVDCDSRRLFQNAAEFATLYPDAAAAPFRFYAPRIEDGWLLETIRATLPGAASRRSSRPAALRWHVDRQSEGVIEGWIIDDAAPDAPVELEVLAGDQQLGCLVANRYRIDLDHAGIGHGACGFSVALPDHASAAIAAIQLRTLTDGAMLTR